MADVTFTRAEYDASRNRWRLARDVCKGSETVKASGDRYLPRPNASDKSAENKERYDAYKLRAVFYNATGRTKKSLVGAAFRVVPGLQTPALLDYVAKDVDGQGVSIYQQSQSVTGNVLEVGRHGLLVDYPQVEGQVVSVADQQSGRVRATISSYSAESIRNWKTRKIGGQHLLTLVVLEEIVDAEKEDDFGSEPVKQYRVLRLTDQGYSQEVWQDGKAKEPPVFPRNAAGQPWRIIPFQFVGAENNDPGIDDAPLYDMAEINIGHYRNSADFEEAAFLVGQPQPWMAGLDEQWRDHMEATGIYLGSRAPWLLPTNGTCGVWQAQPNTVAKEAMDAKEEQMIALGARLIERGSAIKTATQADNDSAAEHSVLSLVVSNVSEAYTQCLVWMGEFVGTSGEAFYKVNQDFTQVTLDANILGQLFAAVQGGKLPASDFWQYLRDRGVIDPEKTDEQIRDELEAEQPALALDDEDEDDGSKPGDS